MADPNLPSDPKQLALMFKADIERATDGGVPIFQVQPDGRVKLRGGGYAPPWSWAGTLPITKNPDGSLTDVGKKLVTPGSDPSSAWSGMYEKGGPFRKHSQWNSQDGTYSGSIDWGTLLGTIAAGGVIGAGAAAAASGGTAAAGGAGAAGSAGIPTTAGIGSATSLGLPVTAGLGSAGTVGAAGVAAIPTAYGITPGAQGTFATAAEMGGASTLPSTTIGTGAIGPITGGSGSAITPAAGGGTASYLKTLKDVGNTATDLAKGRAEGRAVESGLVNNDNRTATDLYRAQVDSNNAQNRYGLDAAGMENDFATKSYGLDLDTAAAANRFGLDSVNAGVNVGNLELDQRRYALDAPGKRASNSVRGDILANAQDVTFDLPSTIPKSSISGGLRPSMFSANTRALGGEMSSQALSQQRAGDAFGPLPTLPDYMGPTSKLPTYKAPAPYVNPPKPPTLTPQPQANGFDTALNWAGYAGLAAPYLKYLKF